MKKIFTRGNNNCFSLLFQIFTSPGPKARERLLSRCIDKAFLHARFKFSKEQYYEGLRTILSDYK